MRKPPSPCIDVCRYRRAGPAGAHCIACSMTKAQKRLGKAAKGREARRGFVALVRAQQTAMGGFEGWRTAYARKLAKRGMGWDDL
ncbi:DUF1289 domain-containing protein [Jannaschia sp. Os4]|uniref:DUF1289 domain-containing protein n=1 Tax=Jannaschia sp. Os4 TaxID=2807617 RepID=UPI001939FAAA|nr:DUF1289 domain-containing protein [Jannaschia sp. Os4]MBM2574938.1 DUF1289 domain-containing protein [Jannaschia sp. Os4]